jgi:hypothetical protein
MSGFDKAETGAFLYTFTFRLAFVLGVADNLTHQLGVPGDYANPRDRELFGSPPFVRLRMFNANIPDRKFEPANMRAAIQHFYGEDTGPQDEKGPLLYEQWLSLETPGVLCTGEAPADGAYAFHRSLSALNVFLQAFALARSDNRVRPISSRELRPIVMVGYLGLDGSWKGGPMLMHPDAKPRPLSSRSAADHVAELSDALAAIVDEKPFVRTRQWRARGERRRYEGDAADAVVSFQIAAETLAYELWALLLADEGLSEAEVQARRDEEIPFASLLKRELANRLGGSWDLTRTNTPVGRYWHELYLLRNRIIHAGYLPHDGDAEQAEQAFNALDGFLNDRLQTKTSDFPGALRAKQRS